MKSIKTLHATGSLSKDATLYRTNNGTFVTFSLTLTDLKKNGDQWDETTFDVPCSYAKNGAERLVDYLKEGKNVTVEGELAKNGDVIGVRVNALVLGSGKRKETPVPNNRGQAIQAEPVERVSF